MSLPSGSSNLPSGKKNYLHLQKEGLESCYCVFMKNQGIFSSKVWLSLFMVLQELIASRRDEQEARIAAVTEIQRVWRGYFTR